MCSVVKDKASDVATLINDPGPSPKSACFEDGISPWLEVSSVDPVPFSQNFSDLFGGLGLHIPSIVEANASGPEPDVSYDLKHITNLEDIPDWDHDEVEEIVVMTKKRPLTLPTILEERLEGNISSVPTARISHFQFEDNTSEAMSSKHQRIIIRRDTQKRYVVKSRKLADALWVEHIILEVLTDLALPFLPHMRWSCRDADQIYMITDLYEGGTLEALVDRYGSLGSHRAQFYATEIAAGISHLHSSGIVHRHLNPRNIFLDGEGHAVLSGFDRADFVNQNGTLERCPVIDDHMIAYSSPELLFNWTHDGRVDCWSFGMLLYYLFFGTHPYQRDMDDYKLTLREVVVSRPVSADSLRLIHPTARVLILKCLERNPMYRLDIEGIKEQAYFESTNWCRVSSKGLEVPTYHSVDEDTLSLSEALRRPMPLIPSFDSGSPMATPSSKRDVSARNTWRRSSVLDPPVLPGLFMMDTSVASADQPVVEERLCPSDSGTVDDCLSVVETPIEKVTPKKKTPSFWDKLDREERGSVSVNSLEFGKSTGAPYSCAPKLRKYRSALHPRNLFSLGTASFQKKIKKKTQSSGALKHGTGGCSPDVVPGLPNGVHKIGSGIGFAYNLPEKSVASRTSLASFTPGACYTLFHGAFSVRSLGRTLTGPGAPAGRGRSGRSKTEQPDMMIQHVGPATDLAKGSEDVCAQSDDFALSEENAPPYNREEVGSGTFIREMYRRPSWILVPPENLPSPMTLVNSGVSTMPMPMTMTMSTPTSMPMSMPMSIVNRASCSGSLYNHHRLSKGPCGSSSSPKTESAPLTPATLVNGSESGGSSARVPVLITAAGVNHGDLDCDDDEGGGGGYDGGGGGGYDGGDDGGEVNITISKEVRRAMDLAFPELDGSLSMRPTLRLVPSSGAIGRLSGLSGGGGGGCGGVGDAYGSLRGLDRLSGGGRGLGEFNGGGRGSFGGLDGLRVSCGGGPALPGLSQPSAQMGLLNGISLC